LQPNTLVFLQSITTQVSNHIPNNQVAFQAQTISGFIFFATAQNPWLQSRTSDIYIYIQIIFEVFCALHDVISWI
jgi:hypothetical protein